MADYDVAALGLAVPPSEAPVTSYRPAVSVKNQGIHPAPVSGVLRIYDKAAGTLLATFALASLADIAPGDTANVPADALWTPVAADVGRQFLFTADVTTYRDQVEPNNHLAPVTVTVTGAAPPPAPPVEAHASQHEHGGSDELDVNGLNGELDDPQPPKAHKADHENDGADELSIAGLSGKAADAQTPDTHGNEAHQSAYATEAALASHVAASPVHSAAANLEQTANKGEPNGYAGLDESALVPAINLGTGVVGPENRYLRVDRSWQEAVPATHHESHEPGGGDPISGVPPTAHHTTHENGGADELSIAGLSGKAADAQTPDEHAPSHESGGADEMSVAGLSGELAQPQTPKTHANEAHSKTYEDQANKAQANGYCPLDSNKKVPLTNLPIPFPYLELDPNAHGNTLDPGESSKLLVDTQVNFPAAAASGFAEAEVEYESTKGVATTEWGLILWIIVEDTAGQKGGYQWTFDHRHALTTITDTIEVKSTIHVTQNLPDLASNGIVAVKIYGSNMDANNLVALTIRDIRIMPTTQA